MPQAFLHPPSLCTAVTGSGVLKEMWYTGTMGESPPESFDIVLLEP